VRTKRISSRFKQQHFPILTLKRTTNSCTLYVSRNGIYLEKLGTFSTRGKIKTVVINYTRLILWLKKGVSLGTELWDALGFHYH